MRLKDGMKAMEEGEKLNLSRSWLGGAGIEKDIVCSWIWNGRGDIPVYAIDIPASQLLIAFPSTAAVRP